ncbi:MAG TPA: TonB-dependent receptor [Bryobacteraceae bacterium]|nr:TonB-dependent receptor [Bryobacteraceae bacterium]
MQFQNRCALMSAMLVLCSIASGQSLGGAGTVDGVVTDPSGSAVPNASISLKNVLTRFNKTVTSDNTGAFRFTNVPPNSYHLDAAAAGFAPFSQDVVVRTSVPISLKIPLVLAGGETSVTVEGAGADLLENVPYAHNDVDRATLSKLPSLSPGAGLSDAILLSSPGVAADSNGFFHPLGDHAQTTFSIDGQPVSDQQSKQFSTQIPLNALESMELVTGAPNAEFGDKTSLVVNAQTRSGLGHKPFGSLVGQYGSFGTIGEEATLGMGNAKVGNFLVANGMRSGRFLDTPEFRPMHAIGNNGTIFDRLDFAPDSSNIFHLNIFAARNWFQVPNTYDQPGQDQRQRVLTYNIAPGYQHTFNSRTLLTVNPFIRHDKVNYYPSADLFADTPATVSQERGLTNIGLKTDISYSHGRQNLKVGTQIMQTRLRESFRLGLTDPDFNAVCVDAAGDPRALPNVTNPERCAPLGFAENPDLQSGLVPFDLSRGGKLFSFTGSRNINQQAFYLQDSISFGGLNINGGLRIDRYDGLTQATGVQPRVGISYLFKPSGTVLRLSYARTFETPYNENLILSSSTGQGGLATNVFGALASKPIEPGRRNQYNAGLQQSIGKVLLIDADYFWKFTNNAFDFGTLLDTPIQFPISWRKSKIDGLAIRFSTPEHKGLQAFVTLGHTRARYFGPSNGGLIFNSPLDTSVFRIDHDQALQQTAHVRYQRPHNGPWAAFTWRYDSGLAAGAVPDVETALGLTAAQQSAIGFHCGGRFASLDSPIAACSGADAAATRLRIPAPGTANADLNPPRIAPRHLFDVSAGTENLFHAEHVRTTLKFTALNLTNKVALYNFLSTFSGTHFVTPRAYQVELGVVF